MGSKFFPARVDLFVRRGWYRKKKHILEVSVFAVRGIIYQVYSLPLNQIHMESCNTTTTTTSPTPAHRHQQQEKQ